MRDVRSRYRTAHLAAHHTLLHEEYTAFYEDVPDGRTTSITNDFRSTLLELERNKIYAGIPMPTWMIIVQHLVTPNSTYFRLNLVNFITLENRNIYE